MHVLTGYVKVSQQKWHKNGFPPHVGIQTTINETCAEEKQRIVLVSDNLENKIEQLKYTVLWRNPLAWFMAQT